MCKKDSPGGGCKQSKIQHMSVKDKMISDSFLNNFINSIVFKIISDTNNFLLQICKLMLIKKMFTMHLF